MSLKAGFQIQKNLKNLDQKNYRMYFLWHQKSPKNYNVPKYCN